MTRIVAATVMTIAWGSGLTFAQSTDDLKREIAALQAQIGPAVAARLEPVDRVSVSVSVAPVIRLFAKFTAGTPQEKTVSLTLTSASGQLISWGYDCEIFGRKYGSVAAFAEFRNLAGGGVTATLDRLTASWNAGAGTLDLAADVTANAFVPTIRTYLDLTCIGGGAEGPDIGPISAGLRANSSSPIAITKGQSQLLRIAASLDLEARFDVCISLGSVGNLCLPFGQATRIDWTTDFGGETTLTGDVTLPIAGDQRTFLISLDDRTVAPWSNGYRAVITPVISWKP